MCKEHNGLFKTHSTNECLKFEKDGTHKKGFGKPAKSHKNDGNSFAQQTKKLSKLEKFIKKLRKKKYCNDSDNSDSDYE